MYVPAREHKRQIIFTTVSALVACSTSHAGETAKPIGALETVVVSAQRRDERLVDVPISISAISGDALEKSSSSSVVDALKSVPGVTAYEGVQTGGSNISIRGVVAAGNVSVGASPVSYYLDSVPFGLVRTAVAPNSNAYDLERVEVLRGPQGTLFGAGSPGGTVRVLTHPAEFDEFSAKARTTVKSVQDGDTGGGVDAAINIPLIDDTFAVRLVGGYERIPGWIDKPNDKDANDGIARNLRLRADARPTQNLNVSLTGWLSRTELDATTRGSKGEVVQSLVGEPIETDFDTLGLKISYDFGGVRFTSASSYLDYSIVSDVDFSPPGLAGSNLLATNIDADVVAQEISLSSTGDGPWKWTVGGMYRDAQDKLFQMRTNLVTGAPVSPYLIGPAIYENTSESYSVFGEATRAFSDGLFELTAGLRYFHDKVGVAELARSLAPPTAANPFARNVDEFNAVSPRFVATLHPTEQSTVYASYSEGFRSGFQQSPALLVADPSFQPVDPDNLSNYEIGAKAELIDGLLFAEVAAYYMDWQDIQLQVSVAFGASSQPAILNGGSASGHGFDAALTLRPLQGLSIAGSVSVNNLELDGDVRNPSNNSVAFQRGYRLPESPKYTAGLDVDYAIPIGNGGEVILAYGAHYTSERERFTFNGGSVQTFSSDEFLLMSARLGYSSPAGWSASLFADNLTDERGIQQFVFGEYVARQRPRTIGMQVELAF